MSEKSPVVEALNAIAGAAGRNVLDSSSLDSWHKRETNADTAVFSYSRGFSYLWGLQEGQGGLRDIADGLAEAQVDGELTLVIVWDGMPKDSSGDDVAASRYVTPYDWALALSVALSRREWVDGASRPKLRVLILDIASHQSGASFMKQSFFAFHNALPWMQDYRLVAVEKDVLVEAILDDSDAGAFALLRQALPPGRRDANRLVCDLLQPECVTTTFSDDTGWADGLAAVVESWKQQFLRTGDHHAIANLTAPLVLAAGLPADVREHAQQLIEQDALPRRALREALEWAELLHIEETASSGGSPVELLNRDGGVFGRRKDVRFLLVDDQYRLGYHHILAYTLFGEEYDPDQASMEGQDWCFTRKDSGSLSCIADASLAIDALPKIPVTDWNLPRYLDVSDCDVLLLDLRLWEESQDDIRREFMKAVVDACSLLGADKKLSDPVFQRAFQAAKALAESKGVSEIPALTLLPLLLSHYDPSLPIILFSSTHQREVIELVSHRPNIITTFAKPILSGYGEDRLPSEIIKDLRMALKRALDLHEMREVWKRIQDGNQISSLRVTDNKKKENRNIKLRYSGAGLKTRLARMYFHYLQTGRYYDFISLPYELLEGSLTENDSFAFSRRNHIAHALKSLRHRKAHGYQRPQAHNEEDAWRGCAIIEFFLLLDFITNQQHKEEGLYDQLISLQKRAWKRVCENTSCEGEPPEVSRLVGLTKLPWELFFLYTVLFQLRKSCDRDSNKIMISNTSWQAIRTMAIKQFQGGEV